MDKLMKCQVYTVRIKVNKKIAPKEKSKVHVCTTASIRIN